MYRVHNTYPTGSDIVKGIYFKSKNILENPEPSDFKVYLSSIKDVTKKEELNVDIVKVDDYWFYTKPFRIYFTGEYILTWKYKDEYILKQHFTVSDKITDEELTIKNSRLKG